MALDLRRFTPARVGLDRAGNSLTTRELLRFQLDHARARDAVFEELDPRALGLEHVLVRSAARDREQFLRRPDLGRQLADESRRLLQRGDYDAALVIADGLSATAVHRHAAAVLKALVPLLESDQWKLAALTVAIQARVALGDEIGEALGAKVIAMLIGERPGLSSPDSLGIYLTWDPRPGRTEAERNCISNVRTEGIGYELAARKLYFLMTEARRRRISGVSLKEGLEVLGTDVDEAASPRAIDIGNQIE
jgi:ethanolamine ammonia-lyase small subunit